MLAVITFLYRQPNDFILRGRQAYGPEHVNALFRAVSANLSVPFRFVCVAESPDGIECETVPSWPPITVSGNQGCYRRLKAFDGAFQRSLGDVILCLDLDTVILRDLTPLITDDDFRIMRGSSDAGGMLSPYNGSMWLCRAGARERFWTEFTAERAARETAAMIMPNGRPVKGSDQAWISCIAKDEATYGAQDGVYQYWSVRGAAMPPNTRIVFFAGRRKPWDGAVKQECQELYMAWKTYEH